MSSVQCWVLCWSLHKAGYPSFTNGVNRRCLEQHGYFPPNPTRTTEGVESIVHFFAACRPPPSSWYWESAMILTVSAPIPYTEKGERKKTAFSLLSLSPPPGLHLYRYTYPFLSLRPVIHFSVIPGFHKIQQVIFNTERC